MPEEKNWCREQGENSEKEPSFTFSSKPKAKVFDKYTTYW